jgi:hypothetical protein
MWFELPTNVSGISVERQQFKAEFTVDDEDAVTGKPLKRRFFRAPDHFAPQILDLGLKIRVAAPGEGWPEDLPKEEATSVLTDLSATLSNLQAENEKLREMLDTGKKERDELKSLSIQLAAKVKELENPPEAEIKKK